MITVTEKLMMTIFMKMTIISIKMIFPMKKILLENSRKIEVTRYLFYGKLSKRKCNKKHGIFHMLVDPFHLFLHFFFGKLPQALGLDYKM